MSPAPLLTPQELDHLEALAPAARSAWAVEDMARHEEAWLLEDDQGWVLFRLDNAPEGRSPYALPLWPRQELAALGARDAGDQPKLVDLESLLEELLPEVAEKGWRVLPCPLAASPGVDVMEVEALSQRLSEAWTALADEDA